MDKLYPYSKKLNLFYLKPLPREIHCPGNTRMNGKFYNKQWLIENNIDFKENLYSHEDLYFNSQVFATLMTTNTTFTKITDHFCINGFTEKILYQDLSDMLNITLLRHL